MRLPAKGVARDELFEEMRTRKAADADWHGARTFSLIYPTNDDVDDVLREANNLYLFDTQNPDAEPKLRRAGADKVVNPHAIGGRHMASLVLHGEDS